MRVTLTEIIEKFDTLAADSESREVIADFATRAMQADDSGLLEMEPASSAKTIWKALTYLSGVDLRDEPNSYLHSVQDFHEFRRLLNL